MQSPVYATRAIGPSHIFSAMQIFSPIWCTDFYHPDIKTAFLFKFWCGHLKIWSNMNEQSGSSEKRNKSFTPYVPFYFLPYGCVHTCVGDSTSSFKTLQGPVYLTSKSMVSVFRFISHFFQFTVKQNQREAPVLWQTRALKRSVGENNKDLVPFAFKEQSHSSCESKYRRCSFEHALTLLSSSRN